MESADQPTGQPRSRVPRQEVVAELGQRALAEARCRLLESVPGDTVPFGEGVGLNDGRVGTASVATDETLPRVRGGPRQSRLPFRNPLDNAITSSGMETLRISVFADKCGQEWTISVRDRGIGIDPADADRIFQVFDRLHGIEEYEGTEIGLALCQRIVERRDGAIAVDSTPGEGSTFSVALPAPDADTATGPTTDHE